jgi:hypothetical protein
MVRYLGGLYISESKWEWMKRNQRKFASSDDQQSKSLPVSTQHPASLTSQKKIVVTSEKNSLEKINTSSPQHTLDALVKPRSVLFDDNFSLEDFRLLTRRWKEEHSIMN